LFDDRIMQFDEELSYLAKKKEKKRHRHSIDYILHLHHYHYIGSFNMIQSDNRSSHFDIKYRHLFGHALRIERLKNYLGSSKRLN